MDQHDINAPTQPATELKFEKEEDFRSLYSNNVRFETSAWDLKIIFGQLDQTSPAGVIRQQTAISIPWTQAKLLAYFLEVNIAIYEADNVAIQVPRAVVPPLTSTYLTPEQIEQNLMQVKFFDSLHERFFGKSAQTATADAPLEEAPPFDQEADKK